MFRGKSVSRLTIGCVMLLLGLMLMPSAGAAVPAWDAFLPAYIQGVVVTPDLADGVLNYTLTLEPGATITLDSIVYDVDWVQLVAALSCDGETGFDATEGTNSQGWDWSTKPPNDDEGLLVAGYGGTGSDRLYPGDSMTFSFGSLDVPEGCDLVAGFHLGWGGEMGGTGFYKGTVVPEPSSLMLLLPGLAGLAGIRFRRRK